MEKGNKVLIKNTDTIWDGKHGTVINEEDGQVEVRINFETEDGIKQVIEIFNEENLEMERENESLNEGIEPKYDNSILPEELQKYFNLRTTLFKEESELAKKCETENDVTVLGVLELNDEYSELGADEIEGGFWCDDGNLYFGISAYGGDDYEWSVKDEYDIVEYFGDLDDEDYSSGGYSGNDYVDQVLNDWPIDDIIEEIGTRDLDALYNFYIQMGKEAGERLSSGQQEYLRQCIADGLAENDVGESLNEDNEEYFIVREFPSRLYVGNYKYADITQNGDVIPSPKGFDKYELGFVEDKEDAAVFTNEQAEEVANTCGWAYRKYGMNYKIIKAPRRMINNESLNEDLEIKPTKKEDIIHRYVHLEDLDGKEVPNWNFAARIATAEDIEEGCVCELAHDLGYKVFAIEAPGFFRTVIAAKEIKAEDIEEEYADFLQGRACVRELEWK